ncbi:hypothetical protein L7F22_054500 [Adiantum nelumboides]|nr:hypothetical protein [Adiantum nelumboides]
MQGCLRFLLQLITVAWYQLWALLHTHWWRRWKIMQWMRNHGIRGPPSRLLNGNLQERNRLRKEATLHDMEVLSHDIVSRLMPDYVQWSKIYGKSFVFWWGVEPRLAVYDLEHIKELLSNKHVYALGRSKLQREGVMHFIGRGLLMANGDAWTHQRRVVAPAFHVHKLKYQLDHMVQCTSELVKVWHELLNDSTQELVEIEVSEHMSQLAGDIVAKTEFGSSHEKGKLIFLKLSELQKLSTQSSSESCPDHQRRIKKLKEGVESMFMEIIDSRRATAAAAGNCKSYGQDLLGLMLAEMEAAKQVEVADPQQRQQHGQLYSSQQLMDECKTFFFTGHETTWLLLTWTFMLLASNPTWQHRARHEALHLMRLHDGLPNFDMLSRLKVLGMILLESLRLYTPATLLAREAFTNIKITNLEIPKGLSVWVPVLAIHHDKNIWGEDADEFKPERFFEGVAKACKHPMAFMPFSFGPRNCVGQNFAMMEAKIVLCMLLSKFTFHLSPSYRHAPICVLTLQPKHGVPIILRHFEP